MTYRINTSDFKIISILTIIAVTGMIFQSATIILYPLLILYLYLAFLCLKSIQKHIILLLYLVAFFTFLMGRITVPLIYDVNKYNDLFFTFIHFEERTLIHIYTSLYLSLLFIYVGYQYAQGRTEMVITPNFNSNSGYINNVRKLSKLAVIVSSPFAVLTIIDKVRYVLTYGYAQIFMEYESSLPTIVLIFTVTFNFFVYLFLATLPCKKEGAPILVLYALISLFNLAAGDRGEAMLAIFVVLIYLFIRNRIYPNKEIWINKKGVYSVFAAVPVCVFLLFFVSFVRRDAEFDIDNIGLIFSGFFYQQGASINVIGCAYEEINNFPPHKIYSLGAITDYFTNNYLTRILFGLEPYPIGSIDLALKGNSLGATLTYLMNTELYFNGGGMGSSYIAEVWHDFGYLGVIMCSVLYGYVLAKIPSWMCRNIWMGVIALVFLKYIMYAPRARTTDFVAATLSVSFWPIAFCIHLISKYYKHV